MYRYTAYGFTFTSEILLPECSEAIGQETDFSIVVGDFVSPPFEQTNIHRKGINAWSAADGEDTLLLHWEGIATYRATGGKLLELKIHTSDPEELSLFTISEALGLILFQKGDYLLHASAIKVGDEAWVFMGPPGAGKSTTSAAFVKAGCPVLSDDMSAIRFDDAGVAWVYPGFAQLKVWEKTVKGLGYDTTTLSRVNEGLNKFFLEGSGGFSLEPVPLGRLYFLHQNLGQTIARKLQAMELPAETLRHFPLANQFLSEKVLQRLFAQSLQCVLTAQAFTTPRPEGFEALEKWVNECLYTEKI